MSLASKIKRVKDIAIFTRNYEEHLQNAIEDCRNDPRKTVFFRSNVNWKSARNVIEEHGSIPLYIVPVGEKVIKYVAQLEAVHDPSELSDEAIREKSVESVKHEGRWEGNLRTIYEISQCRELPESKRVPFTHLRKLKDEQPLSADFGYSYAVVYAIEI